MSTEALAQHRRPSYASLETVTACLWLIWMFTLPLGHLTGLRNSLAVLVVVATLWQRGFVALRQLPARLPLCAFIAWSVLSVAWSADGPLTVAKLKSDLFIPSAGFAAAYLWSRSGGSGRIILWGAAAALAALSALSLLSFLPLLALDSRLPEMTFGGLLRPLPEWYPGVGDASIFAVLCIGPLFLLARPAAPARRFDMALTVGAALLVVIASRNRNALLVLPLAVLAYAMAVQGATPRSVPTARVPSPRVLAAALATVLVFTLALLEVASHLRIAEDPSATVPPWGSAFITLSERDPRPRMWSAYIHAGLDHPWLGVGFGRLVPGEAFGFHHNAAMLEVDPAGATHAHNLFLNLWLQLGFVGLALYGWLLVEVVRAARRRAGRSPAARRAYAALVSLLVAVLLRDLSDDFLVFGIGALFWILLGCLIGSAEAAPVAAEAAPGHS